MKSAFIRYLYLALVCWMPLAMAQQDARVYRIGDLPAADDSAGRATAFEAGQVQVNGVSVPAYGARVADPHEEGAQLSFAPGPDAHLQSTATAEQLQQLAVYYYSHGWLLTPRDWRLRRGGIGANGTALWVFAAPDGSGWLSYSNSSACVGCAQSASAPFFPEAQADARDNEMAYYQGTDVPIQTTRLQPHLMRYQAEKQGRHIEGLVYYRGDSDLPHWQLEMSLPSSQQELIPPMRDHFVPGR